MIPRWPRSSASPGSRRRAQHPVATTAPARWSRAALDRAGGHRLALLPLRHHQQPRARPACGSRVRTRRACCTSSARSGSTSSARSTAGSSAHSVLAFVATYYYFFAHVLVTFGVLACCGGGPGALPADPRTAGDHEPDRVRRLLALPARAAADASGPRIPGRGRRVARGRSPGTARALSHDADQYAAMPSLHLGMGDLVRARDLAVGAGARRARVRRAAPRSTTVVVVATGNHYVLDVLAAARPRLPACSSSGDCGGRALAPAAGGCISGFPSRRVAVNPEGTS